jgi:hypothetical protein
MFCVTVLFSVLLHSSVLLCCSMLFILLCSSSSYVCVFDCIYCTLTLPPGVNTITVYKYLSVSRCLISARTRCCWTEISAGMNISMLWDVTPCILLSRYCANISEESATSFISFTQKMETQNFSETSVSAYQTTRRHALQDRKLSWNHVSWNTFGFRTVRLSWILPLLGY